MKRQSTLLSFGFSLAGPSSGPPPEKQPALEASATTIQVRSGPLNFTDLHPPYDIGEMYEITMSKRLSDAEM